MSTTTNRNGEILASDLDVDSCETEGIVVSRNFRRIIFREKNYGDGAIPMGGLGIAMLASTAVIDGSGPRSNDASIDMIQVGDVFRMYGIHVPPSVTITVYRLEDRGPVQ